ncbi:MAG: hypothetical protein ACREAQ_05420, partial [Nitrososphaera sp.]
QTSCAVTSAPPDAQRRSTRYCPVQRERPCLRFDGAKIHVHHENRCHQYPPRKDFVHKIPALHAGDNSETKDDRGNEDQHPAAHAEHRRTILHHGFQGDVPPVVDVERRATVR